MSDEGDKLRALPNVVALDGSDGPAKGLVPISLPLRDALADALDALDYAKKDADFGVAGGRDYMSRALRVSNTCRTALAAVGRALDGTF